MNIFRRLETLSSDFKILADGRKDKDNIDRIRLVKNKTFLDKIAKTHSPEMVEKHKQRIETLHKIKQVLERKYQRPLTPVESNNIDLKLRLKLGITEPKKLGKVTDWHSRLIEKNPQVPKDFIEGLKAAHKEYHEALNAHKNAGKKSNNFDLGNKIRNDILKKHGVSINKINEYKHGKPKPIKKKSILDNIVVHFNNKIYR